MTPNQYLKKLLSYKRQRTISFPRSLFKSPAEEEAFHIEAEKKGVKVLASPDVMFLEKPKKQRRRSRRVKKDEKRLHRKTD